MPDSAPVTAGFTSIDWAVLAAYFGLITLIGHRLSARQSSTQEYFLGSRSVPWYAVSASIVATAVSGVTFIGVPALVFAEGGDLRYLQFCLAGFISKWILGYFILPRLYERHYPSPYDFIGAQLGPVFGKLAAGLFFLGAVLGQGVRVFAIALVLELLTGLSMVGCVALIVGFSALHTWLGGIRAVIWTDVVQFFVFIAGGLFAVTFASAAHPDGLVGIWAAAEPLGKTRILDFTTDPTVNFAFWAGVFAMPFQNLAAYGSDQLNTQRMLCCRSVREARLALYVSNAGEAIVVLFVLVGLALWGFYQIHPLDPAYVDLVTQNGDRIFPAFILSEMPAGARGLVVAGIFAAAMSSLDSVLAALAQTSLTIFHPGYTSGTLTEARAVAWSRMLVLVWAVVLGGFAVLLSGNETGLVPLAFSMTAYTYGPMLGVFLLALFAPNRVVSAPLGVIASIVVVLWLDQSTTVAFPWLFPAGVLSCLLMAVLPWRRPSGARVTSGP